MKNFVIVIPIRSERNTIFRNLKSIIDQDFLPKDLKVVLVINNDRRTRFIF